MLNGGTLILLAAMFALLWSASASTSLQPRRSASACISVDFPEAVTPITMITIGEEDITFSHLVIWSSSH